MKFFLVRAATLCSICMVIVAIPVYGQNTIPQNITLQTAINYAIEQQPVIQQSLLDEAITQSNIKSKLADWYPQVNFGYNYQRNFILQTSIIGGNPIQFGVNNLSAAQFSMSQALFNRDVLLAKKTKGEVTLQSQQFTEDKKIQLAADVSKAFYDVVTSMQQIKVATENIVRLEKSLKDATSQYKAGIADKIDFKRATISLNNAKASKKSNEELLIAKTAYLKTLMSYPDSISFKIQFDSAAMEREMLLDTLQQLPDYSQRIEYKLLQTQRNLLQYNLRYQKWSYLPAVSLNAAYNLNFQNDQFSKLYNTNFPNSFAALTLAVPIFQGGKRKANIETANFQLQRNEQDIRALQNNVNAQYIQALAIYKSNLQNYAALKENVLLAKEVYDVVQLQYRAGIKTYLEVVTAETDLRTSQINYFNALNQVLAGKVDVLQASGQLKY